MIKVTEADPAADGSSARDPTARPRSRSVEERACRKDPFAAVFSDRSADGQRSSSPAATSSQINLALVVDGSPLLGVSAHLAASCGGTRGPRRRTTPGGEAGRREAMRIHTVLPGRARRSPRSAARMESPDRRLYRGARAWSVRNRLAVRFAVWRKVSSTSIPGSRRRRNGRGRRLCRGRGGGRHGDRRPRCVVRFAKPR